MIVVVIVLVKSKDDDDEGNEDDTDSNSSAPIVPITVVSAPVVVVQPGAAPNGAQVTHSAVAPVVVADPNLKGAAINTTPIVGEAAVEFPELISAKAESPKTIVIAETNKAEENKKNDAPVVAEQPKAAAQAVTSDTAEDSILVDGEVIYVHYRSSFTSRLIQSSENIQNYYTAIKNKILSYAGIKAKTSWNYEIFTKGRIQCVKLNIKGKALMLNLALDPKEYSVSKYHFTDLSDNPKFDKLPMLLKIKSDRGLKYALELIDETMKVLGIDAGEPVCVDYRMPYETNASLAKRGLVKVILPAGAKYDASVEIREANVSEIIGGENSDATATREEVFLNDLINAADGRESVHAVEEPIFTDAQHADEIVNDFVAEHSIEVIKKARSGKMDEVNIDEICENFEDGEVVTLEALKEKRLISKSAGRVKVLAKGIMTKSLTVEADKFSIQAVKMITLAGGIAKRYN